MNAINLKQPLAIEISEEEILADLLYPAGRMPGASAGRRDGDRRAAEHFGRRNGRPRARRNRASV